MTTFREEYIKNVANIKKGNTLLVLMYFVIFAMSFIHSSLKMATMGDRNMSLYVLVNKTTILLGAFFGIYNLYNNGFFYVLRVSLSLLFGAEVNQTNPVTVLGFEWKQKHLSNTKVI